MRWIANIFAVLLVLSGIIWFLQGINILPGSFMTGVAMWAYIGIANIIIGGIILYFANRRPRLTAGNNRRGK